MILPALCAVKCNLVSERASRANPAFFIKKISKRGRGKIIQVFHLCTHKISKNLAFFCSFCKIFTLHISGKNVGKLTAIQTSTVPHNSVQVSRTPKTCFGKTKWVSLNFSIDKNSQLFFSAYICQLNIQYNARHTASKNHRVGNGTQKEFHVEAKENSSHVTMQTGSWSSSNHATVARTFATVCPHCCSSIE